jgi:hypothetical protein
VVTIQYEVRKKILTLGDYLPLLRPLYMVSWTWNYLVSTPYVELNVVVSDKLGQVFA